MAAFAESLSSLYDAVQNGSDFSGYLVESLLTAKYVAKDERLLHLSIVRKLFSDSTTTCSSLDPAAGSDVVHSTTVDDSTTATRTDLCLKLMESKAFLANLVLCLMCDEQLVCFAASKALVSVLGRKELGSHHDCSILESVLNDILNMVNVESVDGKGSLYCLQLFTDLLKQLRKPLAPSHPTLLCSINAFMSHWPRILDSFQSVSRTLREPFITTASPPPSPSIDTVAPRAHLFFDDKQLGLNLGEFLSLTVELLRYTELGLKGEFMNTLLVQIYFKIIQSLRILTSLVDGYRSNPLYLLKRLLDVLLKINYFSLQCASDFELFKSVSHRSLPRPLNVTQSQAAHPHSAPQSVQSLPIVVESKLHSSLIVESLPSSQVTQLPTIKQPSSTLTSSQPSTSAQPYIDSSSQEKIIHESLLSLLGNPAFVECCQFWLAKFAKVAGVEVSPDEVKPLMEDGLKCTITRKACLLLLEHVAATVVKESKHNLSPQLLLRLERLLNTIVSWARKSVPFSLLSTLNGLLHDDVESPGVDFLRLLFYSILTEQDDCLVRAFIACTRVHNSLYKEYDDIPVDTPLLHLALGVFNIHTLFVKFLSGAGFDSTLLLDFVMSHETNFSHFLFSYLEIVIREKENAVVFNYDLQSACAELDIVDEYMSMDLSGSEDEENESIGTEVELVKSEVVHSQLPSTSVLSSSSSIRQATSEDNNAVIDSVLAKNISPTEAESSYGGNESIPSSSRKRDSCTADELPSAKRTNISAASVVCDSSTAPDLKPEQKSSPGHLVPIPQPVKASQPSQNIPSKVVHDPSQVIEAQSNSSSDSGDPPPTVTFTKVVNCLARLGDTLSRLCEKELLSKRVNNVERIVCLTEQLKRIFPNVTHL